MRDWTIRGLLFLVFAALMLNAVLLAYAPGRAAENEVGRYQISSGGGTHCFVLDTKSGDLRFFHLMDGDKNVWQLNRAPR